MTSDAADFLERTTQAVEGSGSLPQPVEVPEIGSNDERAAFDALAHRIYDGLEGPPDQRAGSAAGRLASALWQRVAEWDEASSGQRRLTGAGRRRVRCRPIGRRGLAVIR